MAASNFRKNPFSFFEKVAPITYQKTLQQKAAASKHLAIRRHIPLIQEPGAIHKMSKEQIARNRYWNFRQLIKAAGGNNTTARILGKNDSFVTAYGGKTPTRNIGDRTAAMMEAAFRVTPGSLDNDPPATSSVADEYLSEIVATLSNASTYTRQFILAASQFSKLRRFSLSG